MRGFIKVITICLLTTTALGKTKVSIDKALKDRMVKAEVICKGGLDVNYKIKNETKDSLEITIPAGWRMNSVKEEFQDILVTREEVLALRKGELKNFDVKGYCCEHDHAGPVKGAKYELGKMADLKLQLLANYMNTHRMDPNTEQYAVWAVSNNEPSANITSANDTLSQALRNFVAVIKDEPIPWYTLQKRVKINTDGNINEHPVNLKAKVNYHVDKECYAYFFVLDSLGKKVGVIKGQWLFPGSNEYAMNVNLKDFKRGKYKVVLAAENKEFINKEFEI
jgi:hypothetical protein